MAESAGRVDPVVVGAAVAGTGSGSVHAAIRWAGRAPTARGASRTPRVTSHTGRICSIVIIPVVARTADTIRYCPMVATAAGTTSGIRAARACQARVMAGHAQGHPIIKIPSIAPTGP